MPDQNENVQLKITDSNTGRSFLINTGASVSLVPPTSDIHTLKPIASELLAINGTPIISYGKRTIRVNLGLQREYDWTFHIANVQSPIIGADFLFHYKLSVDLANKKLIDNAPALNN